MNEAKPLLHARAKDVRTIATLLRPLAFTSVCRIIVSDAGLQVSTEFNGILQANAYIGNSLFDLFQYEPPIEDCADPEDEDDIPTSTLEVSLSALLSCLNIYGTAGGQPPSGRSEERRVATSSKVTFIEITYESHGKPLVLELKESNVSTRCELATLETDTVTISDMPFINERVENQVIMRSKDLTEALLSIDSSCGQVTFFFHGSHHRPRHSPAHADTSSFDDGSREDTSIALTRDSQASTMRIVAVGDTGSTELEFPHRNHIFEQFLCHLDGEYSYSQKNIQHCLRALSSSLKCSIRIDSDGMMSLQCMFPERHSPPDAYGPDEQSSGPERRGFVEIRMLALSAEATQEE